jgi:formimidoylglutamate deiminase
MRRVLDAHPDTKVIHLHAAEQEREVEACKAHLGCAPVQWLLNEMPLDEKWCLVHATHASEDELRALARTGAVVALCPTTEANLGDGLFATETFLSAGGVFAIGSDSHISLSPVEELRWLEYQARLTRKERNVLVSSEGGSLGASLWKRACAGGACASARKVGAIAVGHRADVVVLDTFIFAAAGNVVRDVMVGGRWLVQEGRHFAETAIAAGYRRALTTQRGVQ